MSKKITLQLLVFLLNSFCLLFSQKTDSLKKLYAAEKNDTIRIDHLINICWAYQDLGEYNNALEHGFNARTYSKKVNYKKGEADACNRIAEVFRLQGNYSMALDYQLQNLKISEKALYYYGIAKAHKNIGVIYFQQGDNEKALKEFLSGLNFFEKVNSKLGIGHSYHNLGMLYEKEKNFDKATEYYKKTLEIKKDQGDTKGIAAIHLQLGKIFQELMPGHAEFADSAFQHYLLSGKMSREINYLPGIVQSDLNAGKIKFMLNDLKGSEVFLTESMKQAKHAGARDLIKQSCLALAELNEKKKDYQKAHYYFKTAIAYRDSTENEANTKKMVQLQMQYEFGKVQVADSLRNLANITEEKTHHEQDLQKQKLITYCGIGGFVLMLIIAVFAYLAFKNKQKANAIISLQKDEAEFQRKKAEQQKEIADSQRIIAYEQRLVIEEKQKEILASIHYARKIQRALITNEKYIERNLTALRKVK
ncbi:MAG: tetratricopeptide repeat protein [Bacteroidia bacterium]|nr:tetratricopeptide repeat protein [Bacteroidia bacterium]